MKHVGRFCGSFVLAFFLRGGVMALRTHAYVIDTPGLRSAFQPSLLVISAPPERCVCYERGGCRDRQRMERAEHPVQVRHCTCTPAHMLSDRPGGACAPKPAAVIALPPLTTPAPSLHIVLLLGWGQQSRGTGTRPRPPPTCRPRHLPATLIFLFSR